MGPPDDCNVPMLECTKDTPFAKNNSHVPIQRVSLSLSFTRINSVQRAKLQGFQPILQADIIKQSIK